MNLYTEDIKERLFAEVYNASKKEDILKEVVHECREDLVIVYRLNGYDELFHRDCELVTNEQLSYWGVDAETLRDDALANTMAKRPPMLLVLDVGGEVDLKKNYLEIDEPLPRGTVSELDMYILTNGIDSNGAICIFDDAIMQKVADKLDDNLIIMPSSVHETIVYAETTGLNICYAKDTVNAVNRTGLKEGEFLSGEIYRYDKDSHTLSIIQVPEHEEIPMPDNISMEEMYAYGNVRDGMLQVSEETRMQFDEFMKYAMENIKTYLPQDYQNAKVSLERVLKNNGVTLNALCIVGKERVVPYIYLEQYYDFYLHGTPIGAVMQHIADTYLDNLRPDLQFFGNEFNYENIKDKIGVSVCNAAKNHGMLQDIPHEIKGEFALTYHIKVKMGEAGEGTVLIKNVHLKGWGIDEKTLRETAWYNMEYHFPYQLMDVHEIIEEKFDVNRLPGYDRNFNVYILSNPVRFHGAVYMFDDKAMREVAEKFATDMLLLPMSVNECVLFRRDEVQDLEGLKAEIAHVQRTQIRPEDILSGDIFLFDAQTQTLSKLDEIQSPEQGMTQQM